MEARKITILQTKNQKKSVIMSAATTLAELKSDLKANGIDYTDMTFFEGTSRTELKSDTSILPHDVPYKGTITNELVFMLTNTNKKIKSGATTMSRSEAYNVIKSMGLQDACVKQFGKNFTMCKTADLIALVEANNNKVDSEPASTTPEAKPMAEDVAEKEVVTETPAQTPTAPTNDGQCVDTVARAAISKLIDILESNGTIEYCEKEEVLNILGGTVAAPSTSSTSSKKNQSKSGSPYSDDEIDDMFAEMGIN